MKGTAIGTIFSPIYAMLAMGYHEMKFYSIIGQSRRLGNSWFRFLDDCQILLEVYLIKPDHLLSILNQINNKFHFGEKSNKTSFFKYNDKQNWYKILDRYSQQTNRLRRCECLIYAKPPKAFFNEYTVLSCMKNMYHCLG